MYQLIHDVQLLVEIRNIQFTYCCIDILYLDGIIIAYNCCDVDISLSLVTVVTRVVNWFVFVFAIVYVHAKWISNWNSSLFIITIRINSNIQYNKQLCQNIAMDKIKLHCWTSYHNCFLLLSLSSLVFSNTSHDHVLKSWLRSILFA